MKRWSRLILIMIGVVLALVLYAAFQGRIYVLHMKVAFMILGAVLLVVLLAIFVNRVVSLRKRSAGRTSWVLLACLLLGMGVLTYGLFASIQRVSHRDSLTFDGHVYQLAGRFVSYAVDERTLPDHMDYYWQGWLYACDSSGFICDLVGEFTMRENSRLRMTDGALEVIAGNGRVTFSYTP